MITEVKIAIVSCILANIVNYDLPLELSDFISKFPTDTDNLFLHLNYALLIKPVELIILFSLGKKYRLDAFTAYCLGFVFLIGIKNISGSFGIYTCVLSFFHFSEYVATGISNPQNLSFDSFLVNHSGAYGLAMLVSWVEYFTQLYFLPDVKLYLFPHLSYLGLGICLLGEFIRKLAMLHAGRNFNHMVQSSKSDEHQLVTSGIFAFCRHPSYVGWFIWSLGSQVMLINPICLIIYGVVSFAFFKERIYVEEYTLILFFGDQYREYQRKVGTGIPGIEGYHGPVMWGEKQD